MPRVVPPLLPLTRLSPGPVFGVIRLSFCAGSFEPDLRCRPNECIFGSGKLQGSGFWNGGYITRGGKWEDQFTSNLGKRWTDPVTARRVPSK